MGTIVKKTDGSCLNVVLQNGQEAEICRAGEKPASYECRDKDGNIFGSLSYNEFPGLARLTADTQEAWKQFSRLGDNFESYKRPSVVDLRDWVTGKIKLSKGVYKLQGFKNAYLGIVDSRTYRLVLNGHVVVTENSGRIERFLKRFREELEKDGTEKNEYLKKEFKRIENIAKSPSHWMSPKEAALIANGPRHGELRKSLDIGKEVRFNYDGSGNVVEAYIKIREGNFLTLTLDAGGNIIDQSFSK